MSLLSAKWPRGEFLKTFALALTNVLLVPAVIAVGISMGIIMLTPARMTLVSGVVIAIYLLIAARRPLYGLLIWLVAQPLADVYVNLSLGKSFPDISPTRIAIAFLTALVLARAAVGRMKLASFTKVELVALVFLAGIALSAPRSTRGWLSLQSIFDLYFVPVMVYFLAKNLVRRKEQLKAVALALVILGAYVGLYAAYEQFTGNILFVVGEVGNVEYGNGVRILRGLLGHPHEFGRILGIAIPFNFYFVLEEKRPVKRFLFVLALGIMFVGLFATYRRTAWIAALVSLFVIQWFYPRFRNLFLVLLVGAFGLMYLYRDQLEDSAVSARVQQGNTATLNGRTEGWNYAIELWKRSPVTGHGYGQFSVIAKREGQADTAIESQYLSILVSAGLFGFAPYVLLLALIPLSFVGTFRHNHDPTRRWLIVVLWGAHLSFLVNAYTGTINHLITTSALFLLAGALAQLHWPDLPETG
jgi:O-antigen ligase